MENSKLRWIVLKIVQTCNLNCSYCYVYNRGDESWKTRPKFINQSVIKQLALRIEEHCYRHNITEFTIELHGGEPLLIGKKRLCDLVDYIRNHVNSTKLNFTLQTNGTLLDNEWCDLFYNKKIKIGISIDGPPEFADKYRFFKNGKGSTQLLLDRLNKLKDSESYKWLNPGFLCVINPSISGSDLINWFAENNLDSLDLLLPTANHINPPNDKYKPIDYLNFLTKAFDTCINLKDKAPRVRLFELLIHGLLGKGISLDALGGDLNNLCVVESDGSIGVNDVGRFCGGNLSKDIINIFDNTLDFHSTAYDLGSLQKLSKKCESCLYINSCGGGYLPHRFDGKTFNNPSFYCETLFGLTQHIHNYLMSHTPKEWWIKSSNKRIKV